MKIINRTLLITFATFALLLASCTDDDGLIGYEQDYYVEMFLIVDQPIEGLKLFRTVPIEKEYNHESAIVKNADIRIFNDEGDYQLSYKDDGIRGYYFENSDILIKPNTVYNLEILIDDGTVLTASTQTPGRFEWTKSLYENTYFPKDTTNFPVVDSLEISWSKEPDTDFYILNATCLDTLEYGKYLNPPTNEMNRRTPSIFNDEDTTSDDNEWWYQDRTSTNLIANVKTPFVWLAFKWFGQHEISIYAPDENYLNWFIQYSGFDGTNFYNPLLSSIEGDGLGVFGSASVIRDTTILIKNQP